MGIYVLVNQVVMNNMLTQDHCRILLQLRGDFGTESYNSESEDESSNDEHDAAGLLSLDTDETIYHSDDYLSTESKIETIYSFELD